MVDLRSVQLNVPLPSLHRAWCVVALLCSRCFVSLAHTHTSMDQAPTLAGTKTVQNVRALHCGPIPLPKSLTQNPNPKFGHPFKGGAKYPDLLWIRKGLSASRRQPTVANGGRSMAGCPGYGQGGGRPTGDLPLPTCTYRHLPLLLIWQVAPKFADVTRSIRSFSPFLYSRVCG
jgi:hypothetical protein